MSTVIDISVLGINIMLGCSCGPHLKATGLTWIFPTGQWLIIRDDVFTVSPNRQYRGILSPITPATTGPLWMPTISWNKDSNRWENELAVKLLFDTLIKWFIPILVTFSHLYKALYNHISAGTVFRRQNLTSTDCLWTSESDVYRRQILTSETVPALKELANLYWS